MPRASVLFDPVAPSGSICLDGRRQQAIAWIRHVILSPRRDRHSMADVRATFIALFSVSTLPLGSPRTGRERGANARVAARGVHL